MGHKLSVNISAHFALKAKSIRRARTNRLWEYITHPLIFSLSFSFWRLCPKHVLFNNKRFTQASECPNNLPRITDGTRRLRFAIQRDLRRKRFRQEETRRKTENNEPPLAAICRRLPHSAAACRILPLPVAIVRRTAHFTANVVHLESNWPNSNRIYLSWGHTHRVVSPLTG